MITNPPDLRKTADLAETPVFDGLENVHVARSSLSSVDGAGGRLIVRGRLIEELAGVVQFEQMVGLLLEGELAEGLVLQARQRQLAEARLRAYARLLPMLRALHSDDATTALRTALSTLPSDASALDVLGTAAVAGSAWVRGERGEQPLAPEPGLPHATDMLRMLRGGDASEAEARLLEAYWVTVAEHGFNASTFAARVVASTGAGLSAAVVAGVAALSGPLHGGAPGPVLDMLDRVGTPEHAADYVRTELLAGRRIMGMGHRVYRVRDPRAFVLERALQAFQSVGGAGSRGTSERLTLARAVESSAEAQLARKYGGRNLRANVEFYTAVLLEALGVPRAAFTMMFACARCLGFAAHYAEQRAGGRLIRPSAVYIGPAPAA